jgi:hypothetical protein
MCEAEASSFFPQRAFVARHWLRGTPWPRHPSYPSRKRCKNPVAPTVPKSSNARRDEENDTFDEKIKRMKAAAGEAPTAFDQV